MTPVGTRDGNENNDSIGVVNGLAASSTGISMLGPPPRTTPCDVHRISICMILQSRQVAVAPFGVIIPPCGPKGVIVTKSLGWKTTYVFYY